MGYHLPTTTDYVSADHHNHCCERNPPSTEPGTDYGSAYGSPLYAPANGTVVDFKTSNSNATGRYITIDADDGRRLRALHLSVVSVTGGRVSKGQQIGKTGASGYGSDYGYGAHVHQTLWGCYCYNFCSSCTLDFELYVDSAAPGPKQRVAGPDGANGRNEPNTSHAPTGFLDPGAVGDFDGWINGESVSGNKVWFRGEHSGDYYWSGGFTDKGTHDLANLNPVDPASRTVVSTASANGRNDPSTTGPVTKTLAASSSTIMDGWITGENVSGNTVWFREKSSQDFFWSGGFTSQSKSNLKDLNTPPPPATTRTVASGADANIRDIPYTSSPAIGASDPGEVVDMKAFAHAEAVSGNDVWFQREDGDWSWSGGFTDKTGTGLPEVDPPDPPAPVDEDNPRGLPTFLPNYPRAFQGLYAPYGFTDCEDPVIHTPRDNAGGEPVDPLIDTYIVHWTGTMTDQMDWFSYCNSRSVAPTFYMRRDGSTTEFIPPQYKPAATGPDWNWRSIATETLAAEGNDFTPEQWEEHAQIVAWLATYNGKELNGVPVEFTIDRDHVIGHREALPGETECPGDAQIAGLDAMLERAREIFEGEEPPNGELDPEDYPALSDLHDELHRAFGLDD